VWWQSSCYSESKRPDVRYRDTSLEDASYRSLLLKDCSPYLLTKTAVTNECLDFFPQESHYGTAEGNRLRKTFPFSHNLKVSLRATHHFGYLFQFHQILLLHH
jgi:hypothetical protein